MAEASSLVCFPVGRCDMESAARALAECGLSVVRVDGELSVHFSNGPVIRIAYATGNHVAEESAEIAEGNASAVAMLPCAARFEILIDDLETALDEMNTLIDVQLTLEKATGGFVFNTWNFKFIDGKESQLKWRRHGLHENMTGVDPFHDE